MFGLLLKQNMKLIDRLITVIIQERDLDKSLNALDVLGLKVTRFSSSGGFLGRKNFTLLIGLNSSQISHVFEVLAHTCEKRIEYITMPMEGTTIPMPPPIPVTIGGATIFSYPIERYEEL